MNVCKFRLCAGSFAAACVSFAAAASASAAATPVGDAVLKVAVTAELAKDCDPAWRLETSVQEKTGIATYTFALEKEGEMAMPPVVEIAFDVPVGPTAHYWQPVTKDGALYGAHEPSRFCFGTPIRSFVTDADGNALTFAWSECVRMVQCSQRIVHETPRQFYFHVSLKVFVEQEAPIGDWKMQLRLDRRRLHWSDAVRDAAIWVRRAAGVADREPPASALGAVYSTWYAFNRAFDGAVLERECVEAARLGMKTVIVDDGWQTTHGDWMPILAKIPDMRAHVDRVHRLGMKYVLWYALPFVNERSRHYPAFKGKYLFAGNLWEHRMGVLDPRFPDVRRFIVDQLVERLERWNLDGYKLDFIDFFRFFGANPYDPEGGVDPAVAEGYAGRDVPGVPEAARLLLMETAGKLREKKPDVLLEFRQPYIGPVSESCGNMLRANDCPGDTCANRVRTTDIRLAVGRAAVHSDMLKWTPSNDPHEAARSILSVIFATVQYSMALEALPVAQKAEIAKWIAFAERHREALQRGDFRAYRPDANYPLLEGWSETERIFAVYDPHMAVPLAEDDGRRVLVVNATASARVLVETADGVRVIPSKPYDVVEVRRGVGGREKLEVGCGDRPRWGVHEFSRIRTN